MSPAARPDGAAPPPRWPLRHLRTDREEILDREGLSPRGRAILDDLHRWNGRVGWYRLHLRHVRRWWEHLGRPRPFRVLDVGTGPGGLLEALADEAARQGWEVELVGVDRAEGYVAMARERLGARAEVRRADATALDVPDGAFDLATCTLMMHHLPHEVRTALVAELARVCRGVYLFDLEVTLTGILGWPFVAPLSGLGRDGIHDGWVSLRRASTLHELRALVAPLPVRVQRVFPSAMCTLPPTGGSGV